MTYQGRLLAVEVGRYFVCQNNPHNQGAHNKRQKLYYNSYFAKPFYEVLKLWMSAKYMSNIKSIGAFARLYCFDENC